MACRPCLRCVDDWAVDSFCPRRCDGELECRSHEDCANAPGRIWLPEQDIVRASGEGTADAFCTKDHLCVACPGCNPGMTPPIGDRCNCCGGIIRSVNYFEIAPCNTSLRASELYFFWWPGWMETAMRWFSQVNGSQVNGDNDGADARGESRLQESVNRVAAQVASFAWKCRSSDGHNGNVHAHCPGFEVHCRSLVRYYALLRVGPSNRRLLLHTARIEAIHGSDTCIVDDLASWLCAVFATIIVMFGFSWCCLLCKSSNKYFIAWSNHFGFRVVRRAE